MEEGIDVNITMALLRSYSISNYNDKCALEAFIYAGLWPAVRINEINIYYNLKCPRCGALFEDQLHNFRQCPANDLLVEDCPHVRRTQNLCDAACVRSLEEPCLWLRGILPAKYTHIGDECLLKDDIDIVYIPNDNVCSHIWTYNTYYGDASGGEFTQYPTLRRCGCGLASIDEAGNIIAGGSFTLPGTVQTVPRGEIFVFVFLLRQIDTGSTTTYITDKEGPFKTYYKGHECIKTNINCDLYDETLFIIDTKYVNVTVRWMPSHLTDEKGTIKQPLPEGITELDVKGNRQADIYAGMAAKRACLPLHINSNIIYYQNLVKKIQNRVISIVKSLPYRPKQVKPIKHTITDKDNVEDLVGSTSHIIFQCGTQAQPKYGCARCHTQYKIADKNIMPWLKARYRRLNTTSDSSVPLPYETIHMGNKIRTIVINYINSEVLYSATGVEQGLQKSS